MPHKKVKGKTLPSPARAERATEHEDPELAPEVRACRNQIEIIQRERATLAAGLAEGHYARPPGDLAIIEEARECFEEEGLIEIDDDALISEPDKAKPDGRFVQAWVWVGADSDDDE